MAVPSPSARSMLHSRTHRVVVEMLGTFALGIIGSGSVMVAARTHAFGNVGIAFAFGLAVALVIISSAHRSGAHINPAVTLGLWSIRRFPRADVLPYVIAQCAGAIGAAFTLGWMLGPVGRFGATVPSLPVPQVFAIEMGYSAILAFVILVVADNSRGRWVGTAPTAIGVTVFVGAFVTGPLTGGSFNPARSLGPAVASGIWTAHWLYWAAPIAGMMVAMQAYHAARGMIRQPSTGAASG